MVDSLLSLAKIDNKANNPRKFSGAREIKQSEERVRKIIEARMQDLINLFHNAMDKQQFSNLFSGRPRAQD